MKPLAWLTWPLVTVFLGCLAALFGVPLALIFAGKAEPSLLVAPFATILASVAAGFSSYSQYLKGKYEVPPWMKDPAVQRLMQSMPPPAPMPIDVFPSIEDALVIPVDESAPKKSPR